jgi:tetratricopeptide (TPR) repeat protein
VVVHHGRIEILDKVYFETGKAVIRTVSHPILDAVAATLQGNPQILRIRIEGHADARGAASHNLRLTRARARVVRRYLVARGVAPARLRAVGYGERRPVDGRQTREAWSRNRRVEFVIERRVDGGGSKPPGAASPPAVTGRLAEVQRLIRRRRVQRAIVRALRWRAERPGELLALVALGEALRAAGQRALAARAYGSIIDLYPSRADMRRFAGGRLERLRGAGLQLAIDTYTRAVRQRPDHLSGHRLLAWALVRAGRHDEALAALEAGLEHSYRIARPRTLRVLREDLGLVAAALAARARGRRAELARRIGRHGATIASEPSLRFVLSWETDANDVDLHVRDGRGEHASFRRPALRSGGALYADVTNGYGPECFAVVRARRFPYRLAVHYYARGPMGYGMGAVQVVRHDGRGRLAVEGRPFVVMNDGAFVELGLVRRFRRR